MGDHLAVSRGLLQAPLNPLKTDVLQGPSGLSCGPGRLWPHRNSATAHSYLAPKIGGNRELNAEMYLTCLPV